MPHYGLVTSLARRFSVERTRKDCYDLVKFNYYVQRERVHLIIRNHSSLIRYRTKKNDLVIELCCRCIIVNGKTKH